MNTILRLPASRGLALTTSILALAIAASIISPPVSHAQQDRQLTQKATTNTTPSKRIALVIGNGAYISAPPLKNPPNDARDMAATLKVLGFAVSSAIDADQRTMKRLIREFGQQLKGGGQGLFYYAGHGVQMRGRNYLIPANADITSETDVEDQAVDLNLVLGLMDEAQNGLNIVILDACRNNPFSRSFRSASSGLAQVDAPTGTLIAYATSPGRVASDGQGRNGLYTSELLSQMRVSGIGVEEMFKRVRASVQRQTTGQQVPWESSSLVGNFYFAPSSVDEAMAIEKNAKAIDPMAFELSYWDSIKNSTSADDFKAYLEKYPNGQFAALAKNRISTTEVTGKPRESKPEPANNSATELAFWDAIKNSTSAGDYRAYLEKYPNGEFVALAKNRLAPLEAAERNGVTENELARSTKSFKGQWGYAGSGTLVIAPNKIQFVFDNSNRDISTSIVGTKEDSSCNGFAGASVEGNVIRDITYSDATGKLIPKIKRQFEAESAAAAIEALAAVRRVCTNPGNTFPATSPPNSATGTDANGSLTGTTWTGDSPGGDKHYQVQFLPKGQVIWNLKWNNYGESKGFWRQEGTAITLILDGYLRPVLITLNGDTMNGSWSGGQYKFTLTRVQ